MVTPPSQSARLVRLAMRISWAVVMLRLSPGGAGRDGPAILFVFGNVLF